MENVSVLLAIGVNEHGFREVLGVVEGMSESKDSCLELLRNLYSRGLEKIDLMVSDKSKGLVEALTEIYPASKWQRCHLRFHRNVLAKVSHGKKATAAAMLKAIHAQESAEAATGKAVEVAGSLDSMKLAAAAAVLREGIAESVTYYRFPRKHHRSIRTNPAIAGLERIMKEIRRRTRVAGCFPDGKSALMLACARLRYVASKSWSDSRVYLDMKLLAEENEEKSA